MKVISSIYQDETLDAMRQSQDNTGLRPTGRDPMIDPEDRIRGGRAAVKCRGDREKSVYIFVALLLIIAGIVYIKQS